MSLNLSIKHNGERYCMSSQDKITVYVCENETSPNMRKRKLSEVINSKGIKDSKRERQSFESSADTIVEYPLYHEFEHLPTCCVKTLERFQHHFQAELVKYTSSFIHTAFGIQSPSMSCQSGLTASTLFHHLPHLVSSTNNNVIPTSQRNSYLDVQLAAGSHIDNARASELNGNTPFYTGGVRKRKAKVTDVHIRCKIRRTDGLTEDSAFNNEFAYENRKSTTILTDHRATSDIIEPPRLFCTVLNSQHLRKAKLMFLYKRYPNSQTIRECFSEVLFTKSNTSQLIKWFSNFREYLYNQVEKHVRQMIEGYSQVDVRTLSIVTDSSLYRMLVSHYDKTNRMQVPSSFLEAINAAIIEFKNAILEGKDVEPSWKKGIYKIIARMDVPVPECFKNPLFNGF